MSIDLETIEARWKETAEKVVKGEPCIKELLVLGITDVPALTTHVRELTDALEAIKRVASQPATSPLDALADLINIENCARAALAKP